MTVAAAALGAAVGGRARRPRLAAPGALLLVGGLLVMWWGLGIFRKGGTSGGFVNRTPNNAALKSGKPNTPGGTGGGDSRLS